MAQLTLQVDSPMVMDNLKTVLSLMKGVRIIESSPKSEATSRSEIPNATTLAAMKEAESGRDARTVCLDDVDGFVASLEN